MCSSPLPPRAKPRKRGYRPQAPNREFLSRLTGAGCLERGFRKGTELRFQWPGQREAAVVRKGPGDVPSCHPVKVASQPVSASQSEPRAALPVPG